MIVKVILVINASKSFDAVRQLRKRQLVNVYPYPKLFVIGSFFVAEYKSHSVGIISYACQKSDVTNEANVLGNGFETFCSR